MKVTVAKFTRRYNVAQYEHEEYSLEAVVDDGESSVNVLQQLKADVASAYAGETVETEDPKPAKAKKGKKAPKPEPEESEEEESNEEEIGDEDIDKEDSESDSDSDDEEETIEEDEEEVEDPKPKKKGQAGTQETKSPGKKVKPKKPQTYDRSMEAHKELFSGVLRLVAPDWKKTDASKAKAKSVSAKMEGKPFLDAEGEVLKEFKVEVKKLMAAKK